MFKKSFGAVLLILLGFLVPRALQAQPAAVLQRLQVEQIVEAFDGTDGAITERELTEFIRRSAQERLDQLPVEQQNRLLDGLSLEEFSEEQATRKVINSVRFDCERETLASDDNTIRFAVDDVEQLNCQLDKILNARLDPPLPAFLKDLLPFSIEKPAPRPVPPAGKSFLQRLDEKISVRQSFLDERGIGRPATFSWTSFGDSDETLEEDRDQSKFEIRGAVTLEPYSFPTAEIASFRFASNPVFVYEVDSSSEDKDKRNSIIHRVGLQSVLYRTLRTGHNFDLTVDYTTDRDYRSELIGLTFQYTPNAFDIGLGQYLPRPSLQAATSPVYFRWRPFLGLTAAEVRDPGDIESLQDRKDVSNGFFRVLGEVLIGSRVKITPEANLVWELENENEFHDAYGIAAQWLFDPNERLSLVLSYDYGESAPTFKQRDVFKVALGLKL